jgi:hypothetical protein
MSFSAVCALAHFSAVISRSLGAPNLERGNASRRRNHNLMSSVCGAVFHSTAACDASGYSSSVGRNHQPVPLGTANAASPAKNHASTDCLCFVRAGDKGCAHMNAPLRSKDNQASGRSRVNLPETDNIVPLASNIPSSNKQSLIRRLLRALVAIFSSPKGDQGGWEGGARGL